MAKRNSEAQVLGQGHAGQKETVRRCLLRPEAESIGTYRRQCGWRLWRPRLGHRHPLHTCSITGCAAAAPNAAIRSATAGDWPVGGARIEARRLRRIVDEGGDPMGELQDERAAATMGDLCDRFEKEHLGKLRPSTAGDYKACIKNYIRPALAKTKVAAVEFADVDKLHAKITKSAPIAANRCVAILSKMFSLAIRWKMRDDNPAKGIERNPETKRTRYMTGEELQRLVKALATFSDQQTANIIRVLLLTGCRRGEALGMRWADIDLTLGIWSKPGSTTKQKSDHMVPLSAPVRQLLSEISRSRWAAQRPTRVCLHHRKRKETSRRTEERLDGDLQGRQNHRPADA